MGERAQAYPLDLVRTRLAAQTGTRYYHGIAHALATIVREEGARGLYSGLGATLLQARSGCRALLLRLKPGPCSRMRKEGAQRRQRLRPHAAVTLRTLSCGRRRVGI